MIWDWIKDGIRGHEALVFWLLIGSAVTFVGSLILLPVMIVRMAPDYFMPDRESELAEAHPVARIVGIITKNVFGLLLFLAGIAMLFIPGQGLLSMLMGLALMDFPGKRALELSIVRRPKVHRALNWIRGKYDKEPLQIP